MSKDSFIGLGIAQIICGLTTLTVQVSNVYHKLVSCVLLDYKILAKHEKVLFFYNESTYHTRTIVNHSWSETSLNFNPQILDPIIEEFPCLEHK